MSFSALSFKTLFLALMLGLFTHTVQAEDTFPIPKEKLITNTQGHKGGKIVLALNGNPESFNPILYKTVYSYQVLSPAVYQGLMDLDYQTMQNVPLLATSETISNDGLTYTYSLRQGVRWSDGKPFTADDVLFTFQVLLDPHIPNQPKEKFKQADGTFPQIRKIDDHTVEFKLSSLNVLFTSAVASALIIPKHIWETAYINKQFQNSMLVSENPANMVSTGPFVIDTFVPDQRIVLKRNPYYYAFDSQNLRLPYFDKIVYVIVPDFQTALIKFQNGETDMHEVKADEYDLIEREQTNKGFTLYNMGSSYDVNYLMVNQNTGFKKDGTPYVEPKKLKVFGDKRFRQALSYALDRSGLIKTIHHGHAEPVYAFTPPGNKIWFNSEQKTYPFDIEKAKALLASMGLKDANSDGLLEFDDGTPIQLKLKVGSESRVATQYANVMKNDFKKMGLDVVIHPLPFNSLIEDVYTKHDFDLTILSWASAVPPDPVQSKSVILSSGESHNWNPGQTVPATSWEKEIDALMFQNERTLDLAERKKYWHQILNIWGEELPQIMIASRKVNLAIRNHIGNIKPVAIRPYYDWNIAELYDKTLNVNP